jgi:hypothetical protein
MNVSSNGEIINTTPLWSVLKRVYGTAALSAHNYSTTLSSVGFAGTIVGMLVFGAHRSLGREHIDRHLTIKQTVGYLSDKIGRKFGMVRFPESEYKHYYAY